jgi:N-acetylmuramoyl-L-alanine amidase
MSIAKAYGYRNWRTIYDHPQNSEFRRKRPNPDVLRPGDQIYIPDRTPRTESCASDKQHTFQVGLHHPNLQIRLEDSSGDPASNVPYRLVLWSGRIIEGQTDSGGVLRESISVDERGGQLTVPQIGMDTALKIGHLDPIIEPDGREAIISGAQARLNNLGYDCGDVDGVCGTRTKAALKRFQADSLSRPDPDGEPDDETLSQLEQHHVS